MGNEISNKAAEVLAESLDVSDSSYEAAARRYHDLGKWLHDKTKSKCAQFNPYVFPQGSFRLGTVIKPWKREDYDLDLGCKLQTDISTFTHSQEALKQLVGADLEAYRIERAIHEKLEERHRCWRLNYKDAVKFHMDAVPSIPHSENTRQLLLEKMVKAGTLEVLARNVADQALAITDNRHPRYRQISQDWNISNPEGYAKWFESQMRQARVLLESRASMEKVASIDQLPAYRWKTPLQRVIQILKRHRDVMFEKNQDGKPISIIITTLAAKAYTGESDLQSALQNILSSMDSFVSASRPRVPNPVNPSEDFADKWDTPEGRKLQLEKNFHFWLAQARTDFEIISTSRDRTILGEQALQKFGASLDETAITAALGTTVSVPTSPKVHHISHAAKPWRV